MLRVNVKVERFEYDGKKSKAAIDAWTRKELKGAALAFFKAALPLIHIDTGMSIASFTNLARFVGQPLTLSHPVNVYTPPKRYQPPGYAGSIPRLFSQGVGFSTPISDIIGISPKSGKPQFQYWTRVWQFVVLDVNENSNGEPPWQAFNAGNDAAISYLSTSATRLPGLDAMMSTAEVRVLIGAQKLYKSYRKRRQATSY